MNPLLRGHVQYSLHALSMARGGTEERIIAAAGCGEPGHDHPALVAHRRPRDHARGVLRDDPLVVLDGLVHGLQLSRMYEHPVVAGPEGFAAGMKRERDERAAGARQLVSAE